MLRLSYAIGCLIAVLMQNRCLRLTGQSLTMYQWLQNYLEVQVGQQLVCKEPHHVLKWVLHALIHVHKQDYRNHPRVRKQVYRSPTQGRKLVFRNQTHDRKDLRQESLDLEQGHRLRILDYHLLHRKVKRDL